MTVRPILKAPCDGWRRRKSKLLIGEVGHRSQGTRGRKNGAWVLQLCQAVIHKQTMGYFDIKNQFLDPKLVGFGSLNVKIGL